MQTIELRVWTRNGMHGHQEALRLLYNQACGVNNGQYFQPMLFTGKLDKNGKKIFCGDILKIHTGNYPLYWRVEYSNIHSGFVMMWVRDKKQKEPTIDTNIKSDIVEVVGNIFENHEMIKQ